MTPPADVERSDAPVEEAEAPARPDDGHGALGRSSLLNLVGFGVYGLFGFALVVIIGREMGPTGAGVLLTAIAVFNIVARSAMAGTDLALVRFTSRFVARGRHREVRRLYAVALPPVLAISGAAGLATFLLADPLGRLLATEGGSATDLADYLRVLAPFIPVATAYQVVEGGSRGFGTMVPGIVVERLGRSAALPALLWAVLAAGGGIAAIGLAWAGPFALALVPMALWTASLLRRAEADLTDRLRTGRAREAGAADATDDIDDVVADRPAGAPPAPAPGDDLVVPAPLPTPELRRRFWGFAIPRSFAGVFALTITWVDALLLGALEGSDAVGVYTTATRWLIVGNFAGNAVTVAFGPQIAKVLATDGAAGARRMFQAATAWFVLLAWPPYLAAMAFAPLLVKAFGDDFGDGAAVITITGAGFLLAAAAGPIDMLLLMAGRSRLSLINTGIALAANVVANLVLIPPFGIRGAAVAWTVSLVVANAVPLAQMARLLGITPYGPRSLRALGLAAACGVALVAARLVLGATFPGLAVGLAAGGGVLLAGIALSPDRMGVADILRRRVS